MKLTLIKKTLITGMMISAIGLAALPALAANGKCPDNSPGCTNLTVAIPGFLGGSVANPVDYILGIYKFSLSVGGLLAMAIIVFAGIKRITSAGNPSAIGDANDMITNALWGLALLFGAFLILSTINPKLTNISLPGLESVNVPSSGSTNAFSNFSELSRPLNDARQNDLTKAQTAYDAAQKIQEDTYGIIKDRYPDESTWTPEQKARVLVATYEAQSAQYDLQTAQANAADLQFNTVRASICATSGTVCGETTPSRMTSEQQTAFNQALQARNATSLAAQTTKASLDANSTEYTTLKSRYNIQLKQE